MKMTLHGIPQDIFEERGWRTFAEIHRAEEFTIEQLKLGNRFQMFHCDKFYLLFVEELRRVVDCRSVDLFSW